MLFVAIARLLAAAAAQHADVPVERISQKAVSSRWPTISRF